MAMRKRWRLGLAVAAVAAAVLAAWLLWPRPVAPYSIERIAAYHDPALLRQAWALPVARRYRTNFVYQGNPSICGPTSIADVLRSEGGVATPTQVLAALMLNDESALPNKQTQDILTGKGVLALALRSR